MLRMLRDGVRGPGSFVELATTKTLEAGDLAVLAEREHHRVRTGAAVGLSTIHRQLLSQA